jgi:hypothetical protein
MKQNINEVKRMQQLAGVINENQLNEFEPDVDVAELELQKIQNYLGDEIFNTVLGGDEQAFREWMEKNIIQPVLRGY